MNNSNFTDYARNQETSGLNQFIDFQNKNHTTVISINKFKLTHKESSELKSFLLEIIDNGKKNILLDLKQIDYLDSVILGVMITANKHLKKKIDNGKFALTNLSSNVKALFTMLRMDSIIDIFPTEKDAFKVFDAKNIN